MPFSGIIGDQKRIKLVMQVFKINNARTEEVAQVKFNVWWHFIWLLGNKVSANFDMVSLFCDLCMFYISKEMKFLKIWLFKMRLLMKSIILSIYEDTCFSSCLCMQLLE